MFFLALAGLIGGPGRWSSGGGWGGRPRGLRRRLGRGGFGGGGGGGFRGGGGSFGGGGASGRLVSACAGCGISLSNHWTLKRRFPNATLDAIEAAVAASEARHRGEIRFAIESALDLRALWRALPARERALEAFAELRVWDTREQNGVLIYMLLADRDVEIVADRGFDGRVRPEEWHDVCAGDRARVSRRRWHEGALLAVEGRDGARCCASFRAPARRTSNEQPNRPRIL